MLTSNRGCSPTNYIFFEVKGPNIMGLILDQLVQNDKVQKINQALICDICWIRSYVIFAYATRRLKERKADLHNNKVISK